MFYNLYTPFLIMKNFQQQQELYAELIVKIGVNLQPGQSVRIGGRLAQAEFIRLITAKAYQAGARYVHVDWLDTPIEKARMQYSKPEYLDFLPDGSAHQPLRSLVRFFIGAELDCEVQLVLKKEETPSCELGGSAETAPRLGWLTWARTEPMPHDPDDGILQI